MEDAESVSARPCKSRTPIATGLNPTGSCGYSSRPGRAPRKCMGRLLAGIGGCPTHSVDPKVRPGVERIACDQGGDAPPRRA